ncbi:MAG TPA: hypothetical protein VMS08_05430 [Candidatus Saccharimonadia bacterium]|nr:hypothetical protein [Candidatus Saccharimonadia bacterium]
MKTLSRSATGTALGLILTLSVLPLNALAVSSTPSTGVSSTTGFCANLAADETKVQTTVSTRLSTLDQNRSDAAQKLQEERANFDAQVTTNRANWDADRQKNFTALEAKATTATEQQAVSAFEQTVLADVATHRSTIDAARDTFRAGEDQALAGRQAQVNTAVSSFQSAISTSESAAQSSCDSGATPSSVRLTFVMSMKNARISYQTAVAAVPKIDSAVQSLAATRKSAVTAADTTFTAAVEKAGKTLKTALHQ